MTIIRVRALGKGRTPGRIPYMVRHMFFVGGWGSFSFKPIKLFFHLREKNSIYKKIP